MYQKIIIVGNLGRDPEMRYMNDGTAVTDLRVATSRKWNDKASGESREETLWFRVSVWGRQGEVANQYLSKGRRVLVEGVLTGDPQTGGPKIWTRQDGTSGASFEIRADTVRFLSSKEEGGFDSAGSGDGRSAQPAHEEDDIPF
jgi:single-strand DNA-binding protein